MSTRNWVVCAAWMSALLSGCVQTKGKEQGHARAAFVAARQADGRLNARYHLRQAGGEVTAKSSGSLVGRFDATGVALRANGVEGRLRTMAAVCDGRPVEGMGGGNVLPRVDAAAANRLLLSHVAGFDEWWVNGPMGLEQGFDVNMPQCYEELVIELGTSGFIASPVGDEVRLRGYSGTLRYGEVFAIDAAGRSLPARLAVAGGEVIRLSVALRDARWPVTIDPLVYLEDQRLGPVSLGVGDLVGADRFGNSAAISGDIAIVGAPWDGVDGNINQGSAYVFVRSAGDWILEKKIVASDGAPYNYFGASVALSGETAVVGAPVDDVASSTDNGWAYVFIRDGGAWSQQQRLAASDGVGDDRFGASVALDTDTAVVGAPFADAAYVFARTAGSWTEQQKLTHGCSGGDFGRSVALSAATAVIGSPLCDVNHGTFTNFDEGAAFVFVRGAGTWSYEKTLLASDGFLNDQFGTSVALSGDVTLVGSPLGNVGGVGIDHGAAYVFARTWTVQLWAQEQKLVADDAAGNDRFGYSVALVGDTALVGSPLADGGGASDAGSAYVFLRGAPWSQARKLVARDGAASDLFGVSVALSSTATLVGARGADGVGPSGVIDEGAAYFGRLVSTDASGGSICAEASDCTSGFCVDGVCCDAACGGSDATDCQACSVAAGAVTDGVCVVVSTGTPCSDGDACTQPDTCQSGTCTAGGAVVCTAIDSCHDAGTCNSASGCSNPAKADDTTCDDGDSCSQTDTCQAGICVGGNPLADDTACSDGDACTQTDTCQVGECTGTNPITCTALDQCHNIGSCNPTSGLCSTPTKIDGVACDDGDACTQVDTCQTGTCIGANPVVCVAIDSCHGAGTCDPGTGQCSSPMMADGAACNDHNACTQTDTCQSGTCVGANTTICEALDQCHTPGSCNPASGCTNPTKPSGTSCNDNDACTQIDSCQAGVCTGANPITCTPLDPCHDAGTCDPVSGQCSAPAKADGTTCDDSDVCTHPDTCLAGECVGTPSTCGGGSSAVVTKGCGCNGGSPDAFVGWTLLLALIGGRRRRA